MNGEDSFITIVSENFNEIRRNFERGLCKIGYEWDEECKENDGSCYDLDYGNEHSCMRQQNR